MAWYSLEVSQPEYYEVVDAILKNKEEVRIWKSWDEEHGCFIYTKFGTMIIIPAEEIMKWKSNI